MANQPAGTLTFLFTDIEASTRRWQEHPEGMRDALQRHDSILADCLEHAGGRIFKHTGDGMCAVFGSAPAALGAATEVQRRLGREAWEAVGGLRVRIGLHTGEATERDGDYFGPTLNRAARVMAAAHGGQVLVSATTAAVVEDELDGDLGLRDLGQHDLPDLAHPERLYQLIAPGLADDFPPLRAGTAPAHNLPLSRSSFVGRAEEIGEVAALVTSMPAVTLVGIGGTGKTRLAIEVAHRLLDRFEAVHFVDLAPLSDGQQIPAAIATACGLVTGGPTAGALWDTVVASLGRRSTLLLLDNCEHLVDDCAQLVDELLDRCDRLAVLATSREALSVEGERTWPVGSLPLSDSVELFVERALTADARFQLNADTEASIREICQRLDGIPLAIELAAARVGHLSPAELALRLDDRFRLLTGGRRRRTQRQQTLRAAVDWSYDLLDGEERRLLRRLSVFAGGFTLSAAEAVCADDDKQRARAVDLLGSLVAKSLVVAERTDAGTRFGMLETIRLYAADRLMEEGEADRLRDAHRDYWSALLRRSPVDDRATRWDLCVELEVEIDNLRAALDWSESQDRPGLALATAVDMGAMWSLVGHHEEALLRFSGLLSSPGLDGAERARALAVLCQVHMSRGDFEAMGLAARESLALAPEDHWSPLAYTYAALGLVFDPAGFAEAHELFDGARRVAGMHDLPRLAELATGIEAHFWLLEGDLTRPVEAARSTAPMAAFGDMNVRLAAVSALIVGEKPEAALQMAEDVHRVWGEEWGGTQLAFALIELGRRPEAAARLRVVVDAYLTQPYPLMLGDCLVALGALRLEDDPARAAALLESAVSERGLASFRSPATFILWTRYRKRARASLGTPAYEAARDRGHGIPPLEALREEAAALATSS